MYIVGLHFTLVGTYVNKVKSFEDGGVIVSRAKDAAEKQEQAYQLTSIQCYRSENSKTLTWALILIVSKPELKR